MERDRPIYSALCSLIHVLRTILGRGCTTDSHYMHLSLLFLLPLFLPRPLDSKRGSANPTVETLVRYAEAVGKRLVVSLIDARNG